MASYLVGIMLRVAKGASTDPLQLAETTLLLERIDP